MANNLMNEYQNYIYEELTSLDEQTPHKTWLVQNKKNRRLYVKKKLEPGAETIAARQINIHNNHIVEIETILKESDNSYIIEQYISGRTLEDILEDGPVSEEYCKKWTLEILDGLEALHKQGIVHRDITPSNIIISNDHVAKIIDFGIARIDNPEKKKDTTILGTVGYAAPEQFGFHQTDARCDIYAVGTLMNIMLTGEFPNEHLYPYKGLQEIIQKATQVDANQRYSSSSEMANAIDHQQRYPHFQSKSSKETCWKIRVWEENLIWIPGFRSGYLWKMLVAVSGYFLMILSSIIMLTEVPFTAKSLLIEFGAICLYIWSPIIILSNFLNWENRIPIYNKMPKAVRVLIRVLLAFIIFYVGVCVDNIVRPAP